MLVPRCEQNYPDLFGGKRPVRPEEPPSAQTVPPLGTLGPDQNCVSRGTTVPMDPTLMTVLIVLAIIALALIIARRV